MTQLKIEDSVMPNTVSPVTVIGSAPTKPYSLLTDDWAYNAAAGGIVNTTTAVTIKAAVAGKTHYITEIDYMSEALTTATELVIRSGAGGTVIWRAKIGTVGLLAGRQINFVNPIRALAVNTLLEVCTLTASGAGAVYFNASGYTA